MWAEVDRVAELHAVPSDTDSLQDTRAQLDGRLVAFKDLAAEMPEDTRGVAVALGGRLVMMELLPGARSFATAFPKLLSGYAFEALDGRIRENGAPTISEVEKLLAAVARSRYEAHPAVGTGVDVRFEREGLSGYALVEGGDVLHAAVFVS